jgi:hypothetical protein
MKLKSSLFFVMVVVLFAPQFLRAQCLDFRLSTIPMAIWFDMTNPWGSPYMQIPAVMDISHLQSIPLPSTGNSPYNRQLFCDPWELFFPGSGVFVRVFVPTASERMGDYSSLITGRVLGYDALGRPIMEGAIYDPATERVVNDQVVRDPFPGNIIPPDRMGNPFIWLSSGFLEPTAQESVRFLTNDVEVLLESGTLTQDQADGLMDKLVTAITSLDKDRTRPACNKLGAFINQVNAFIRAGKLSPEEGQALIDEAEYVRDKIGC